MTSSGSGFVAADAQFSIASVLKPYPNFEDRYQGQPSSAPVAFPGTRDALAGQDGYDPDLLRGVPCPLGALMMLLIPKAVANATATPYDYQIIWRMRNVRDYRLNRSPYHVGRQSPGAPDTDPGGGPRFVIPGIVDALLYEQALALTAPFAVTYVQNRVFRIPAQNAGGAFDPLLVSPNAFGVFQQGVLDPATVGTTASDPLFLPIVTRCRGDEFMVLATRSDWQGGETWDFASDDFPFSEVYGKGGAGAGTHPSYPDVGIYVLFGTSSEGTAQAQP